MFKFGRNGAAPSPSEFSTKELQRIQRRFLKLSQDRYRVPISAFQSMPELSGNPFVAKILHLFDGDRDGFITLEEFTSALQWFRTLQHPEDKLSLVFRLYDLDSDGYVGEAELISTMREMQRHLSQTQLEQIARSTIREYDKDNDGKLSMAEFRELVGISS
mmetsp:Transcript_30788/g.77105  ORF Transcript_30788/g.77105 Transcript_30788/m.77105 type:complete len:161 (-) Transcript_30788:40-522(-)|eukprot:jgi/Tetstr1/435079/TSEL_024048.t1